MAGRRGSPAGARASGDAPPDALAGGLAFCALDTTGPDPAVDALRRLAIHRIDGTGTWSAREWTPAGAAAGSLASALGAAAVVAPSSVEFEIWYAHFAGRSEPAPVVVGLDDLTSLLSPARAGGAGGRGGPEGAERDAAQGVRAAAAALVTEFRALGERAQRLAGAAWERLGAELEVTDPASARRLALAAALVEAPVVWIPGGAPASDPENGPQTAWDPLGGEEERLEGLAPLAAVRHRAWAAHAPSALEAESEAPFPEEDLRRLDAVFREHLPALLAGERTPSGEDFYRVSQHEVATEIARTFGAREFLLVHAPTGTGKTLAYLVPALLWATRYGVRVAVATYTRALQEQAMEREVPRALAALARAGLAGGPRVSVLKGRANYVCWKGLSLSAPAEDDGAEAWLAWTVLVLFALTDETGDLDRLSWSPPARLVPARVWREVFGRALRAARAGAGCCTRGEDRERCAAELARRRAERSHVVLTNHSFALARQEFFRHVLFDECEHLHDQAHNAWSRSLSMAAAREALERLCRPDRSRRAAPLDRLTDLLVEGTASHRRLVLAGAAWERARGSLDALARELDPLERWRRRAERGRGERDAHSLLREYAESAEGAPLVGALCAMVRAWSELETALAALAEGLSDLALRDAPAVRRALDRSRAELAETSAALEAWMPLDDEGRPSYRRETFYDVESARGGHTLVSRVLLPDEYLGRQYYPLLASATFLSAAAWIQGSFRAARAWLGLDRLEKPLEDEEREARTVRTWRAPEVFDYSRVLVAVPRDAPAVSDKEAWLAWVRAFVGTLAERTRGRVLVLFTNAKDTQLVGEELTGFLRARRIPLWYQGMPGAGKEEIATRFRERVDSVLLGVDTFWYGADFPGETLEYLVLARLPYGVPDRYHYAQCAVLGESEHRKRLYIPRALAKFRQGFGRLMRSRADRGCVFILDARALEPRHRAFLRELPLADPLDPDATTGARWVRGDAEHCLREASAHMDLAGAGVPLETEPY